MTCDQTCSLLNALTDRELNLWQAWRVRRHLAGCAVCAAQFTDIQRLDASVQSWCDIPAPVWLDVRIAAALPSDTPRLPPRSLRIRRAYAGLAILATFAWGILWFLPGQPGQPIIAFADVEKAMQQVQTISCRTVQYCPPNRIYRDDHYAFREWDRRNPPAIAMSNTVTTEPANYSSSIQTLPGLFTRTAKGEYRMHPYKVLDRKYLKEGIEREFRMFTQRPISQHFDNGSDYNVVADPEQRVVTFNGQRRILFTFNEDIIFRPNKSTPGGATDHSRSRVWVDPATRLVVRRETITWDNPYVPTTVVNDDFHYNQSPPPGVFDWPPKGAKVQRF